MASTTMLECCCNRNVPLRKKRAISLSASLEVSNFRRGPRIRENRKTSITVLQHNGNGVFVQKNIYEADYVLMLEAFEGIDFRKHVAPILCKALR